MTYVQTALLIHVRTYWYVEKSVRQCCRIDRYLLQSVHTLSMYALHLLMHVLHVRTLDARTYIEKNCQLL